MLSILPAVCTALFSLAPVESRLEQVAPAVADGRLIRSEGQTRAVVLIHGFLLHFRSSTVPKPRFRDWQRSGSRLVRRLAKEADVFAFSYGQNASLDEVVHQSGLRAGVARLRELGYREVVLVGHSAGGLLARHFVEDYPDAGVTKVIQVCAPNGGTPAAKVRVHKNQQAFLDCLTEEGRRKCLQARAKKRLPKGVEFVCVLGTTDGTGDTDGVVPCACQWTPDLRAQGVPVVPLRTSHRRSVRGEEGAETITRLVRDRQLRWTPRQTREALERLFKD